MVMSTSIADALSAYSKATGGAKTDASATGGQSFADALKGYAGDAVDALKEGEKAAAAGASGKADLASVVTALNNAQMMLQTVVGIRDKVIAAYQDIERTAM